MPSNGARSAGRQQPRQFVGQVLSTFEARTEYKPIRYLITGVTRDSTGAALGDCVLKCFESLQSTGEPKGRLVATGTSDANGNYSIEVHAGLGVTFQIDAYKAGSPDVSGTTVNTLVGVAT